MRCREATQPCVDPSECCTDQGLTCATTTLGMVCCGLEGTGCATENGEDCCGDLLCIAGTCLAPGAMPLFQAPFPCGQSWTYSHHDPVGLVGSTGASSGPHLHFEELLDGVGKDIWIDGQPLAPDPGVYGQASITSNNCP